MESSKRSQPKKKQVTKTQKVASITAEDPTYEEKELPDSREKYMTLGDHLEELRWRIFAILGVWILVSVVVGIFSPDIHAFLVQPYRQFSQEPLILGSVYGSLEIYFKLALIWGFIGSLPVNLVILWGFIAPAVSKKTSIIGYSVVLASTFLFWFGVWFAWEYLFPLSLNMMFQVFLPAETVAQTSIEKYYSFLFLILIGTGVMFQLPLLVIFLGFLEIVTLEWHKKAWKFIVVVIFFLSAFITPPDPLSMVVMALPLILLYFISVSIVWFFEWNKNRIFQKKL